VRKACTRSLALLGGAVPEFQGKGVLEGCLEYYFESEAANGVRYTDLELSWVGDFNPKMTRFLQWIGAKPIKNHITYRYLFDRSKEFKRSNLL